MVLAASLVLTPIARGADAKVTTENDVVYAKPGGTELKLDLARPAEGDGPFPVVLVIHGGGLAGGEQERRCARPWPSSPAEGYVAVSPQYRFCPKETFPAQVHDVKAAVRWLKAHAKDYKVDPEHVGAVGFSAGGHLSMMLGLTGPSDGLEGEVAEGRARLEDPGRRQLLRPDRPGRHRHPRRLAPLVKDFLGGTPEEKPKEAAQASPLTFVSKGDAPILTFQGTKDPLVPHTQAIKLADAMTAAGVPGRVELLVGAGHGWGGDDLKRTMTETFAFFDKYLKNPGR